MFQCDWDSKVGHSCMRRVVDCAGAPGAKGNVVIGRAGRAFLDNSGISAEVFNISRVRARLQRAMDDFECSGDMFVSKVWMCDWLCVHCDPGC